MVFSFINRKKKHNRKHTSKVEILDVTVITGEGNIALIPSIVLLTISFINRINKYPNTKLEEG